MRNIKDESIKGCSVRILLIDDCSFSSLFVRGNSHLSSALRDSRWKWNLSFTHPVSVSYLPVVPLPPAPPNSALRTTPSSGKRRAMSERCFKTRDPQTLHDWIPAAAASARPQENSGEGKFPLNWRPATVTGRNGFTNIFQRRARI